MYKRQLQGKGLATNTVNTYISSLRALYNMACQEALIPASYYPFENLKLRRAMTARRAIPASLFQQIAQIKVADDPQVELSIDLSLFSFMACGIPFVDIAYLTRQNIRGNELVYHRHKTGRMIRLEITSSCLLYTSFFQSGVEGQDRLTIQTYVPSPAGNDRAVFRTHRTDKLGVMEILRLVLQGDYILRTLERVPVSRRRDSRIVIVLAGEQ